MQYPSSKNCFGLFRNEKLVQISNISRKFIRVTLIGSVAEKLDMHVSFISEIQFAKIINFVATD